MAENMLVRIKPLNPKKGHLRRTHIEQKFGMRFRVEGGWYEVPVAVARELRKVTQNPDDPESPEVFDVVTRAQAHEIRQYEELRAEKLRATPDAPTKLAVRRPRDQRAPGDNGDETDLGEELRTPAPTPRRTETRAGKIAKETALIGAEADDDDADADGYAGTPPFGVPESDPLDSNLSDVEAASEPPTMKFEDDVPAPRRGRGRPRRNG